MLFQYAVSICIVVFIPLACWDGLVTLAMPRWGEELGAPGSHLTLKESRAVVLWVRIFNGSGQLNGEHTDWLRLRESCLLLFTSLAYLSGKRGELTCSWCGHAKCPRVRRKARNLTKCLLFLLLKQTFPSSVGLDRSVLWESKWHPFEIIC